MSLDHSLPLMLGKKCDLLLTKKIWQRRWDVISIVKLHKIITFILLENSLLTFFLASFDEVSHHIAKPTQQGNKDGFLHIDSKKLRSSVLKTSRKWIQSTTCRLRTTSFSSWAFKGQHGPGWHLGCILVEDPEAEDPTKPHLDFWPTKLK